MERELRLAPGEVELLRSVLTTAIRSERGLASQLKSAPGKAMNTAASVDLDAARARLGSLRSLLDKLTD